MTSPGTRRIVFLNRYFWPDISATSQLLSDLSFALAADGNVDVHVVCSRQAYEDAQARMPPLEQVQGVTAHRVWSTRLGRSGLPGRALDYLSFYASASWTLWRLCHAQTTVIAKTDPPLISVPAGWIARRRGARLVNWLQDLFPEVASALGVRLLSGAPGRAAAALRDASLKRAAANVVLGERMAERVASRGVARDRIHVIPNWADLPDQEPPAHDDNPLRREWGFGDRFVVMYSGNMGRAHEFDTTLEAAALLRDDPRIGFLWVGGGAQLEHLRGQARARRLTSFGFQPYQPRERLALSLAVGDVHLVTLRPELEGLVVPSKFYGILAAARPVVFVGDQQGELARLIRMHGIGQVVRAGDAPGLRDALLAYVRDPGRAAREGAAARRLLHAVGLRQTAVAAWRQLLGELP